MILKPYEVGDLVEYVVDAPTGELGVIIEINHTGRPWVQWLIDNSISSPDYDRFRPVEAKNAV
ncbi:MAG: hypothetical protein RIR47_44 [Bacteroidota bacterium]|jgi:hypothetical protein